MTSSHDAPAGPESVRSSGRRHAVCSLAGIGAVGMALMGHSQTSSASVVSGNDGLAGPESLSVGAAKKKKGKRGPTGPTGPTGPAGSGSGLPGATGPTGPTGQAATLTRDSEEFPIADGAVQSGQVNCPSGEASGGGAGISNTNCAVIASGPVGTDAWAATGKCPSGQSATLVVMVICLE